MTFPLAPNDPEELRANRSATTLTWIGHSTCLVQIGGLNLLTDPQFSERASPLPFAGPRRLVPPGLSRRDLPAIDMVLISHNHYDHLDRPSLRWLAARNPRALCCVPRGLASRLRHWGFSRVREMIWWEQCSSNGARIHCVPAQHSSARLGPDRNRSLWSGWVVEIDAWRFLFAGDTGYGPDFAEIRRRLGPIDLAALPIGAYEPRWFMRHVHATPEEAVRIHLDLECRFSVGVHWGTFRLTDEPLDEPPRRLAQARQEAGLRPDQFVLLKHGETLTIGDSAERTGPH